MEAYRLMSQPTTTEKLLLMVAIIFPLAVLIASPWPGARALFSPHHPCLTGVYPVNHPRCSAHDK